MSKRRILLLALLTGILQVVGYYVASAVVNGPGPWSVAQPDTLLYCQAARRIVEGCAFSFSAGTAVSTGTTSVLYPFVLALPYWFGAHGPALYVAGFLLNAIFYLVFILGWSVAFCRWLDSRRAVYAVLMLALFPQPAYCALAQSDTGLWMCVSALTAGLLAAGCRGLVCALVVLGPWVRPEGLLVSLAVGAVALIRRDRLYLLIAVAGLLSAVAVCLFNCHLTGVAGYSSVANKGYFTALPFDAAVEQLVDNLVEMLREVVLGHATSVPRAYYTVPVFGAIAVAVGLLSFDWKKQTLQSPAVFCLAACLGFATVAQSGWQGTNFDRYLSWCLPLLVLFHSVGWLRCSEYIGQLIVRRAFLLLPFVFQIGVSVQAMTAYHASCADIDGMLRFARQMDRELPSGASVGINGWCGLAYEMGERRIAHLSAIYSPEFAMRDPKSVYEILKNEKETRFDYWLRDDKQSPDLELLLGESLMIGPDGFVVRKADWSVFDATGRVPVVPGKMIVDRVDVGYEKDERRVQYEIRMKYALTPYDSVLLIGRRGDEPMIDVGKMVCGYDEMSVSGLTPGKDLCVVLRTVGSARVVRTKPTGAKNESEYVFDRNLSLRVAIDGRVVSQDKLEISTDGFSDVCLQVPGKDITAKSHRLAFLGDHVACGYWFYQ